MMHGQHATSTMDHMGCGGSGSTLAEVADRVCVKRRHRAAFDLPEFKRSPNPGHQQRTGRKEVRGHHRFSLARVIRAISANTSSVDGGGSFTVGSRAGVVSAPNFRRRRSSRTPSYSLRISIMSISRWTQSSASDKNSASSSIGRPAMPSLMISFWIVDRRLSMLTDTSQTKRLARAGLALPLYDKVSSDFLLCTLRFAEASPSRVRIASVARSSCRLSSCSAMASV